MSSTITVKLQCGVLNVINEPMSKLQYFELAGAFLQFQCVFKFITSKINTIKYLNFYCLVLKYLKLHAYHTEILNIASYHSLSLTFSSVHLLFL